MISHYPISHEDIINITYEKDDKRVEDILNTYSRGAFKACRDAILPTLTRSNTNVLSYYAFILHTYLLTEEGETNVFRCHGLDPMSRVMIDAVPDDILMKMVYEGCTFKNMTRLLSWDDYLKRYPEIHSSRVEYFVLPFTMFFYVEEDVPLAHLAGINVNLWSVFKRKYLNDHHTKKLPKIIERLINETDVLSLLDPSDTMDTYVALTYMHQLQPLMSNYPILKKWVLHPSYPNKQKKLESWCISAIHRHDDVLLHALYDDFFMETMEVQSVESHIRKSQSLALGDAFRIWNDLKKTPPSFDETILIID